MLTFLIVLLILWVVVAVMGFIIKGLLWLGFLGVILFLITAAWIYFKGRQAGKDSVD